ENDPASTPRDPQDFPGHLKDGHFLGISQVHGQMVSRIQESVDSLCQIGYETETPGLGSVSIDRKRFPLNGLGQKTGDGPPVADAHPGPIRIEDTHYLCVQAVAAMVSHGESLGNAPGLIVNSA